MARGNNQRAWTYKEYVEKYEQLSKELEKYKQFLKEKADLPESIKQALNTGDGRYHP